MFVTNDPFVIAAAVITVSLMVIGTGWYVWLVKKRNAVPSIVTWLLFFLATTLSLATYASGEKHDLINNVANLFDPIITGSALFIILKTGNYARGASKANKGCLIATGIIFVVWLFTLSHDFSNLAIQSILTIAYIPMIVGILKKGDNNEPIKIWLIMGLGSVVSAYPAFASGSNLLAKIYAVRAVLSVSSLILVILFARYRAKFNRVC